MHKQKSESPEFYGNQLLTPARSKSAQSVRLPPIVNNKVHDVHENRKVLKDLLKDVRNSSRPSSSLSNIRNQVEESDEEEEEEECESLELTKTESGAIILKEDENKLSNHNSFDDFDHRMSVKSKPISNNSFEEAFSYYSESKEVLDNKQKINRDYNDDDDDEEEADRLESFYNQEAERSSVYISHSSSSSSSSQLESQKSSKNSKTKSLTCSEYLIQEQLKNFSIGSMIVTPRVAKNENGKK